jgi:hypothetical protein
MRIALFTLCVVLSTVAHASAQIPWTDRVFANVSGGAQSGRHTIAVSFTPTIHDEPASIDVTRDVKGGGFWDVTVGGKVRGPFGAALSFSGRSAKSDAALTASIPDPIAFDSPRSVSATIPDLEHKERWVGILGVYFYPLAEKVDLMLMAGPTVVSVEEPLITSVSVEESGGPVVTPNVETFKKSFWGYHLGVDVRYMFTTNIGAGGFLRVTGASGNLQGTNLEVGGFQVGGGIRIRY